MEKAVLGRIDCPCCRTPNGMRFTLDRNGKPFGHCDAECSVQMRVGGDANRERQFAKNYPEIAAAAAALASGKPVTVTVPEKEPIPPREPKGEAGKPAADPVTEKGPPDPPVKARSAFGQAVDVLLGGAHG